MEIKTLLPSPERIENAINYLKNKKVNLDRYVEIYDIVRKEDKVAIHGKTKGFQEMVTVHDYKTGNVLREANVGYSNKFRFDAFM